MTDLTQRARDVAGRLEAAAQSTPQLKDTITMAGASVIISELVERIEGVWQDIETAPADCERLMLWSPRAGIRGKGAVVFGRTYKLSKGIEVRGDGMLGDWEFTHWMPLPPPPSVLGKQEGEG